MFQKSLVLFLFRPCQCGLNCMMLRISGRALRCRCEIWLGNKLASTAVGKVRDYTFLACIPDLVSLASATDIPNYRPLK